jgi:hypothetical protein
MILSEGRKARIRKLYFRINTSSAASGKIKPEGNERCPGPQVHPGDEGWQVEHGESATRQDRAGLAS